MKYSLITIILLCIASMTQAQYQQLNTERIQIQSEDPTLPQYIQISLPYDYGYTEGNTYPVLYLIDGDYNFHTATGIVESLTNLSADIPDMIVVGIAGAGGSYYKINNVPNSFSNLEGRADEIMDLIEQKISPYLKQHYRASDFEILFGQSLGGLFTINYFVERPEAMDYYISADPSIWYNNTQMLEVADSILAQRKEWNSSLYMTAANSKGMNILEMAGVLDRHQYTQENWSFKSYPNESHGSVAIPTIRGSLLDIFDEWSLARTDIYNMTKSEEFLAHYSQLAEKYDSKFIIPGAKIGSFLYSMMSQNKMDEVQHLEDGLRRDFPTSLTSFYVQKGKILDYMDKSDEALKLLQNQLTQKESLELYDAIAKSYLSQGKKAEAQKAISKAISLGEKAKIRLWHMNELSAVLQACK